MAFFGATISAVPDIARSPCWLVARTSIVTWRPSGAFDMTLATIVMTSPGRAGVVVSIGLADELRAGPGQPPGDQRAHQRARPAGLGRVDAEGAGGGDRRIDEARADRRRLRREQREILRGQRMDEAVLLADLQRVERAVFDRRHGTLSYGWYSCSALCDAVEASNATGARPIGAGQRCLESEAGRAELTGIKQPAPAVHCYSLLERRNRQER